MKKKCDVEGMETTMADTSYATRRKSVDLLGKLEQRVDYVLNNMNNLEDSEQVEVTFNHIADSKDKTTFHMNRFGKQKIFVIHPGSMLNINL